MKLVTRDLYDDELLSQVRPADWKNPTPSGRYNLVAIGGGTAGLVAAIGGARFGAKAALVESRMLGGDCLNFGCMPSKALLRSARSAHQVATACDFGLAGECRPKWDFAATVERLRRLRAEMGHHDSAQRCAGEGVDVYFGTARFTGRDRLAIDGQELRFSRAVIATGSQPAMPAIEGLAELGPLTNETIFSLTELPHTLIVIGAGPVGCELAQAFRRLGSEVHLISHHQDLLPKEDTDVAEVIRARFAAEGIHLHLGWQCMRAARLGPSKSLVIERQGHKQELIGDEILVAIGRQPATGALDLPAAGVEADVGGVIVNDYLQTSNRRIYAAGDVCTGQKYTHAAYAMSQIVLQNALFLGRQEFSRLNIPRTTFTDPEVAHVGLTAGEAQRQGLAIASFRADLAEVDRAIIDGDTRGFAVIHTHKRNGRVVGGTIVAEHAGEMIGELALLLNQRLTPRALARTIHCYPTRVEVLKHAADQYERTRFKPYLARVLKTWLAWRR